MYIVQFTGRRDDVMYEFTFKDIESATRFYDWVSNLSYSSFGGIYPKEQEV